jgi:predicted Rossmann-fold nucleotide-binding protein
MSEFSLVPNINPRPSASTDAGIDELVERFKSDNGIEVIVAFSGGADSGLGDQAPHEMKKFLEERMREQFEDAMIYLGGYRIAILSGGTSFGVPGAAARAAKAAGLATIGVYPKVGEKYALPDELLDLRICVEPVFGKSAWGDESPVFTKLLDGVIVYGGGAGTLIEAAHILKCNETALKHELRPKFIVPISGSGGTADALPYCHGRVDVRAACMPQTTISTGRQAATWLEPQLNLFDYPQEA